MVINSLILQQDNSNWSNGNGWRHKQGTRWVVLPLRNVLGELLNQKCYVDNHHPKSAIIASLLDGEQLQPGFYIAHYSKSTPLCCWQTKEEQALFKQTWFTDCILCKASISWGNIKKEVWGAGIIQRSCIAWWYGHEVHQLHGTILTI